MFIRSRSDAILNLQSTRAREGNRSVVGFKVGRCLSRCGCVGPEPNKDQHTNTRFQCPQHGCTTLGCTENSVRNVLSQSIAVPNVCTPDHVFLMYPAWTRLSSRHPTP
jgi:hypothetical protein